MKNAFNTVAEQLIYTACFFATQAMIARSVSIDEFAQFSSFYSAVILLSIIHACTVSEPILVFIEKCKKPDIKSIIFAHIPTGAIILACIYYIEEKSSTKTTIEYFIALISFTIYWTSRSLGWQSGEIIKHSAPAILQVTSVALLTLYGTATLSSILVTISASLLITPLLTARDKRPTEKINLIDIIKFSSLNLASQTILWGMTHGLVIYYLSIGSSLESSQFRILLTLILPAQYINIALSNYFLPILSREQNISTRVRTYIFACLSSSSLYSLTLYALGNEISTTIFGGKFSKIDVSTYFFLPTILSIIQLSRTILKARKRNTQILISFCAGATTLIAMHFFSGKIETSSFIALTISATFLSIFTISLLNRQPSII